MKSNTIEHRLKEIQQQLAGVVDPTFDELRVIIHRPGWTTVAEEAFVLGQLDVMSHTISLLKVQSNTLLSAAQLVGSKEATVAS